MKKPLYKSLYFQVVVAIVVGILLGYFFPETGAAMKPLGDGFIKLIKTAEIQFHHEVTNQYLWGLF